MMMCPYVDDVDLGHHWDFAYHSADRRNREVAEEVKTTNPAKRTCEHVLLRHENSGSRSIN